MVADMEVAVSSTSTMLKAVEEEIRRRTATPIPPRIETDEQLGTCSMMLRWVKTKIKDLTEQRLAITRPMDEAKKKVITMFEQPLYRLETLESGLKNTILVYEQEMAEQRRLQQEAENERARKQEEARKAALVDAAEAAIETGNVDLANRFLDNAENTHVEPINVAASKRPGIASKSNWKWRVKDESKIPKRFWMLDEKKINAVVRAEKKSCEIPGIEVYEEKILAARGY